MKENEMVVATMAPPDEQKLSREATDIELRAEALVVSNEAEYAQAAEFGKFIKAKAATITEFFKPMKDSAYQAHKAICEREKTTLAPLKNAESIIKKTMSAYVTEQERKRREHEEALRLAAERERERLLAEAAERDSAGDIEGAEEAFTEAVIMDEASAYAPMEVARPKVAGVSTSRDWEIVTVNSDEVPISIGGFIIRPVDQGAIMRMIRASKGTIKIPGVEYKEVAKMSFRK